MTGHSASDPISSSAPGSGRSRIKWEIAACWVRIQAHPGPMAHQNTGSWYSRMDASGLDLHWWSRKELRRHKSDLIVSTYQCLIFFILKHSSIENTICSKEKWENVHSKNNKILQKMATNPYKMCLWCLLCARSAYEHLSTYCVSKKKIKLSREIEDTM